jgi:hypothetical protein
MRLEKASMPEQWARTIHRLYQIVVGGSSLPVGILGEQEGALPGGTAVQLNFLLDVGLYSSLHAAVMIP